MWFRCCLDLGKKVFQLSSLYKWHVLKTDTFHWNTRQVKTIYSSKVPQYHAEVKPCRNSNVKYSLLQMQETFLDFMIYTSEDFYQKTTARKREKSC